MKKYIVRILTLSTLFVGSLFSSCSDDYMEDLNTDPSKAPSIDPNAQLSYRLTGISEK